VKEALAMLCVLTLRVLPVVQFCTVISMAAVKLGMGTGASVIPQDQAKAGFDGVASNPD
jgi:hypothetical protein